MVESARKIKHFGQQLVMRPTCHLPNNNFGNGQSRILIFRRLNRTPELLRIQNPLSGLSFPGSNVDTHTHSCETPRRLARRETALHDCSSHHYFQRFCLTYWLSKGASWFQRQISYNSTLIIPSTLIWLIFPVQVSIIVEVLMNILHAITIKTRSPGPWFDVILSSCNLGSYYNSQKLRIWTASYQLSIRDIASALATVGHSERSLALMALYVSARTSPISIRRSDRPMPLYHPLYQELTVLLWVFKGVCLVLVTGE